MADTKTSAESAASTLTGAEIVRGVQSAANVKMTADQIAVPRAFFQANNSGATQTTIADATDTKAAFGTEEFDIGSAYDATLSRWTPPAGRPVRISACVFYSGTLLATSACTLLIYKNGAGFKAEIRRHGNTGSAGIAVSCIDNPNGTDYYECFINIDTASGTGTIAASASQTNFCGHQI